MQWASALSTNQDLASAVSETSAELRQQLAGAEPDLVLAFVGNHFAPFYDAIPAALHAAFPAAVRLGCSAGGVIGAWREIEHAPGLALVAAQLPDVDIVALHFEAMQVPAGWEACDTRSDDTPHFILLPDPFTFDADTFIGTLDRRFPTSKKIGGLASGASQPGMNALFLGDQIYRSGAVGVSLIGNLEVDTVVAQGCRPVGNPLFITRCQKNILYELDGEPCLEALRHIYETLPPDDQELAQRSLFLGLVMEENRQDYHKGDFLIRNIIGADNQRQALAIGSLLHDNQVVQFHVRDAKTSADDLDHLLADYAAGDNAGAARGALLFSCLGRGAHLYGTPDHDSRALRKHLSNVPVAGFFCNGEIGPVKNATFLHGYTSSIGLFRSKR